MSCSFYGSLPYFYVHCLISVFCVQFGMVNKYDDDDDDD